MSEWVVTGETTLGARSRRVGRGLVASLLNQLINVLSQIALVPLFLATWGAPRYGEWLAISAAVGYLAMLDFGVQSYVVNKLGSARALGQREEFGRTLHSALAASIAITSLGCLVAIAFAWFAPLHAWLGFEVTPAPTARAVFILLSVQVAVAIPQGVLCGVYRSLGEYARGVMIANVQRAAALVWTGLALWVGSGLATVAAIQLLPLFVVCLYAKSDLQSRHEGVEVGLRRRDWKLARSFFAPSFLFLLVQLTSALQLQGSVLLMSTCFGVGSVAVFVSLRTLANLSKQLTSVLTNTLWPELTILIARERFADLRAIHRFAAKLATSISLVTALVLFHCGDDIVGAWTSGRLTFDDPLMRALALAVLLQTPWTVSMYFLLASNRHARFARFYLVAAVLGLGLGALLSVRFGPSGIVIGMTLAELFLLAWSVPLMAARLIRTSVRSFYTDVYARGALITALAFTLTGAASSATLGWLIVPRLVVVGGTAVLVVAAAAYALWLSTEEKARLRVLVARGRVG